MAGDWARGAARFRDDCIVIEFNVNGRVPGDTSLIVRV